MKTFLLHSFVLTVSLILLACTSSKVVDEPKIPPPTVDEPLEAIHDKTRQYPYPKEDNELYINPSPLIVPQSMKTSDLLQFQLSMSADFSGSTTVLSEPVPWCIYNPHEALRTGTWYWRFRQVSKAGVNSAWSEVYSFEVKEDTYRFVTPDVNRFFGGLPSSHPRLYCFLDNDLASARANVTSHNEYRALISRANLAMNADLGNVSNPYDKASDLKNYNLYLYYAYHLTQNETYADRMLEFLRMLLQTTVSDRELFASNFGSTDIAINFILPYDLLYERLSPSERAGCEDLIIRVLRYYYPRYCGMQENHIFDNHFWQHNMRVLFQGAFMLYDKAEYRDECTEILEYFYELWTARAPNSGFNRSGNWVNGASYFDANVHTLYYMPALFSHLTQSDFLGHPWYQSCGQALLYTWPLDSKNAGFGDGSEKRDSPARSRLAFADYIARETGDPYAGFYASQGAALVRDDYEFRLYRMVKDKNAYAATQLPEGHPSYVWYEDSGEVIIHSDITDTQNNLMVAFRSSPFGSGSHTLADQNSFNIFYKGKDVFRNTGYYINFSDAHNLLSYRHTRAHNTILVNGIGQPYSTKGYGIITRAMGGQNMAYCLGDASNAYCGISDDPMWIQNFAAAGISQSVSNGFGETPLNVYKRHLFVLYPNTVVIYDEFEASEPVRWDWLLHSPVTFNINGSQNTLTNNYDGFYTMTNQYGSSNPTYSRTDQFVVPPVTTPSSSYPNQWHLTASFGPSKKQRVLTIIQVVTDGSDAEPITVSGGNYTLGEWRIIPVMNTSVKAGIEIRNTFTNTVFYYGDQNPTIGGTVYNKQRGSSVLFDRIDGSYKIIEMGDYEPLVSRAGN